MHGVDGKSFNATVGPYIKALRDGGKKVQAVVNNYPSADNEGVISVRSRIPHRNGKRPR